MANLHQIFVTVLFSSHAVLLTHSARASIQSKAQMARELAHFLNEVDLNQTTRASVAVDKDSTPKNVPWSDAEKQRLAVLEQEEADSREEAHGEMSDEESNDNSLEPDSSAFEKDHMQRASFSTQADEATTDRLTSTRDDDEDDQFIPNSPLNSNTYPDDHEEHLTQLFHEGVGRVGTFLKQRFLSDTMQDCLCNRLPDIANATWYATAAKALDASAEHVAPMSLLKGRLHAGSFVADTAHGLSVDGRRILYDQARGKYCTEDDEQAVPNDLADRSLSLLHHALTRAMTHMEQGGGKYSTSSNSDGIIADNKNPNSQQQAASLKRASAEPASFSLRRVYSGANSTAEAGLVSQFGVGVLTSLQALTSHFSTVMGSCVCESVNDLVSEAWDVTAGGALGSFAENVATMNFNSGIKLGSFMGEMAHAIGHEGQELAAESAKTKFCGGAPISTDDMVTNAETRLKQSFQTAIDNSNLLRFL